MLALQKPRLTRTDQGLSRLRNIISSVVIDPDQLVKEESKLRAERGSILGAYRQLAAHLLRAKPGLILFQYADDLFFREP